jgi:hypothetical protein
VTTVTATADQPGRSPWDRSVVQCNYAGPVSAAAAGARAYLVRPNPGGGDDRIIILVRSRGGRWVEKWENIRRLENFRPKTLPPEHPLYGDLRIWDHEAEGMAGRMTAARARLAEARE